MTIPADLKYSKEHEWVRLEGDTATVGITDFAQDQLTDIVFVELPEPGRKLNAGDPAAVLESVKSVSDVYAPLAGEVVAVNKELEAHPELVNESPYDKGWLLKIKPAGAVPGTLLDAKGYQAFLDTLDH
ncbi:MAG TPA: glycine cleavage system protein GcvH [bacterium]